MAIEQNIPRSVSISYVYDLEGYAFSDVCIHAAGRLTLCGATSAPGITSHWDGLDVSLDILEVGDCVVQLPAVDGLSGLASVLVGHTEV